MRTRGDGVIDADEGVRQRSLQAVVATASTTTAMVESTRGLTADIYCVTVDSGGDGDGYGPLCGDVVLAAIYDWTVGVAANYIGLSAHAATCDFHMTLDHSRHG